MSELIKNALNIAVVKGVEDWAMMLMSEVSNSLEHFSNVSSLYLGFAKFKGITTGIFIVIAPRNFFSLVYKNVTGIGDGVLISEEEIEDCVKEFTNVLAGNFLTEAYGEETAFEIIHPEFLKKDVSFLKPLFRLKSLICYLGDDLPLAVAVGDDKVVKFL